MRPGDRLVCAFVDSIHVGHEFTTWPLHVTIVPWFRNEIASEELAADINDYMDTTVFHVEMGEEAKLGHGKVGNWVQQPTPFTDIEPRVRAALKNHGSWLVDETTQKQRPYKPHVTAQKANRLHEGDKWQCDKLYIVEQKGDHKEVMAEIYLV